MRKDKWTLITGGAGFIGANLAQAAAEVAGDRLHPFGLFTHTFGLDEINAAFQALQRRDNGFLKALIIP
jgi:nucleoside-diphosphate-sugar epimerase